MNLTDFTMDLNGTTENPGEINKNEVFIDTYATAPEKINITP